jgi:hypothetical protein
MPTDPSVGGDDDRVTEAPDDDLTFAVQDLGRERGPASAPRDHGFVPTRATPVASPPEPPATAGSAGDGFVIRDADGAAPSAPVDALVVGAPEPVVTAMPEAPPSGHTDAFQISSATTARAASPGQLWTTRNPAPALAAEAPSAPSRRGWSTRHSEVVDRSAHATMLRLREEAVEVSWKAAWIAVTSCDPRLLRKRAR